jgi:hypothetical protein
MRTIPIAALATAVLVPAATAQITGPSSSHPPYLLPHPNATGVQTVSLLTVGDSVGGYRLAGLPDGMGAWKRFPTARNFGLVVNHEMSQNAGATHAHGSTGAFLSHWGINASNKAVYTGRDHILSVVTDGSNQLGRFCGGEMADRIAFWPEATPLSQEPYIYLNGEEVGNEGRAFAHVIDGPDTRKSWDLPSLGKSSWENLVARPYASPKTVVIGTDDTTPGQVYVYVGDKQANGNTVERAGLMGGLLYGVKVPGVPLEDRNTALGGVTSFELQLVGDGSLFTGAQIQSISVALGITQFLRPEDGNWDADNPADFYFVTTDRFNTSTSVGRSRLWRLRFSNLDDVTQGGEISILLDGTEGQQMFDNMCLDQRGHVLLQEDPGNQAYLAKIWQYDIATDALKILVEHDPARFVSGGPDFITQDEETSGIFDARRFLGPGWFIANVQGHAANPDPELVEYGQILAIFNPESQ